MEFFETMSTFSLGNAPMLYHLQSTSYDMLKICPILDLETGSRVFIVSLHL